MNIYKFVISYIAIIALSAFIYGCGDTISQSATGSGTNVIAEDDGNNAGSTTPAPVTASAEDETEWTDDDPDCSVESREAGRC